MLTSRKKTGRALALLLALTLLCALAPSAAAEPAKTDYSDYIVRTGIYYGSTSLAAANFQAVSYTHLIRPRWRPRRRLEPPRPMRPACRSGYYNRSYRKRAPYPAKMCIRYSFYTDEAYATAVVLLVLVIAINAAAGCLAKKIATR